MIVRGFFVSILLLTSTRIVRAQPCELEGGGRGAAEQVQPDATDLRLFRVETLARVRLEGTRAEVEAEEPLAFRGRAEARSVELRLASAQTVAGVIRVERGVPVRARRVAGVVQLRVEAGATSFVMSARCRDLVFGELPPESTETVERAQNAEAAEPSRAEARRRSQAPSAGLRASVRLTHAQKQPRRNTLRVFANATGSQGVTLRRRATSGPWAELSVIGWSDARARVATTLAPGVTVEGWVERAELRDADGGLWGVGGPSGCGVGYGGARRYRGAATLAEGVALLDDRGRTWARTTRALEVAIVVVQMGTRIDAVGTPQDVLVVYVERVPGLGRDVCEPSRIRVSPTDVTYEPSTD